MMELLKWIVLNQNHLKELVQSIENSVFIEIIFKLVSKITTQLAHLIKRSVRSCVRGIIGNRLSHFVVDIQMEIWCKIIIMVLMSWIICINIRKIQYHYIFAWIMQYDSLPNIVITISIRMLHVINSLYFTWSNAVEPFHWNSIAISTNLNITLYLSLPFISTTYYRRGSFCLFKGSIGLDHYL